MLRGILFDLVLLPLITLSFGMLQARRSERRFRYWVAGWCFIVVGIAMWGITGLHQIHGNAYNHSRILVLLAGPICFVLSFLPATTPRRITAAYAALIGLPLWGVLECTVFDHISHKVFWIFVAAQVISEAIVLRLRPELRDRKYSISLALTSLVGPLLVDVFVHVPADVIYNLLMMQLLLACAVLFYRDSAARQISRWVGTVGFVLWAGYYATHGMLPAHPDLASFYGQIWNIPKYFVALGMLLKVMEEDTARFGRMDAEYRLLYDSNPHPMWIYDPETLRFVSVNDAAMELYGYDREEFLKLTIFDIRPEEDRPKLMEALRAPHHGVHTIWRHRRKDGSTFFVDVTSHEVTYCGRPARFVMTIDITEREKLTAELVRQAQYDSLTGLPNRILLEDRAAQLLSSARRDDELVALFTIDVDRFKSFNDTFGHAVGDECLRSIADRLRSRSSEADTLARTGGEEFVLVVGGLSSEGEARAIAGSIIARFKDPLRLSRHEIKATVSIGVALFPQDGELLDEIRKQSDRALYQAKRLGGNRAVFLTDRLLPELENITHIENTLRTALSQPDGVEVEYQPIYDPSRQICQVEALVRVPALRADGIGPDQFIPLAEENGLILAIGSRVLDIACNDIAALHRNGAGYLPFAVNVSCNQLLQTGFADEVLAILERHHLPPTILHLEITETTLMKDYSQVVNEIGHLASAGVRFSIDDFGTGYSSLERLTELPLDIVKIDRSFTSKLPENTAALGIVQAICHMAHHLTLDIIAEGIETEDQRNLLFSLGVAKFQGFLFSKPLKLAELEQRLNLSRTLSSTSPNPQPANALPS